MDRKALILNGTVWTRVLIVMGLLVSLYLTYSHYRLYTDIDYESVCSLSETLDCETVSKSPWSRFGGVPVAAWGVAAYTLLLIAEMFGMTACVGIMTLAAAGTSIWLGYVSFRFIGAACPFCLMIYAINAYLIGRLIWLWKKRNGFYAFRGVKQEIFSETGKYFLSGTAVFLLAFLFYPPYWEMPPVDKRVEIGITSEGHPYIGCSEEPEVVIHAYSDYMCGHCRDGQRYIRRRIIKGDRIRLVHHNFPLSTECNPTLGDDFHQGACRLAIWGIMTEITNGVEKFWEVNDLLFERMENRASISAAEISRIAGMDVNRPDQGLLTQAALKLSRDILWGTANKLKGTPAYFDNSGNRINPGDLSDA